MAKIRIGIGSDFRLKDQKLGLGENNPQERLDVAGVAKGKDLKVTGISSLTAYEGFLRADHQITENTTLSFDQGPSASLSGEIIVGTGQTVTVSKVEDEFANANDGTIWSTYLSNSAGGFQAAYPASQAFNGKISATETSRSVNSQITSTWTPPKGITYSSSVEVWTYYAGSVSLNGGSAITVNNDQSWRKIGFGSGTLTSITFSANSGNSVYIAGIAIDGEILVDGFSTPVDKGGRAGGSEIECLKVYNTFTPPSGGTNDRPYAPKPGELYYNYDFKTIEFFDGNGWRQVDNTTRSGRGLFAGGYDFTNPGQNHRKNIDYIQIATLGNALNFGDLQQAKRLSGGCSSETRGLFMGGLTPGTLNEIDHVTMASAGTAVDFGNLAQSRYANASLSSSTRGITAGGVGPALIDQMDYVEIATSGNALDFGDIADSAYAPVGLSNGTRGLFCGGEAPTNTPAGYSTYIYSITIASKGDGVEFGHLRYKVYGAGGGSNSVRGIYAGGGMPGDVSNINYITLSTDGNAIDFGNLTEKKRSLCGTASQTRVVLAGGVLGPTGKVNTIEYVNIASSGNGFDFGDLNHLVEQQSACSDSHGGLGGF